MAAFSIGAVACSNAAATPLRPAAAPAAPLASVQLVERLSEVDEDTVPNVTGMTVTQARARLDDLEIQVIAFGRRHDPISAQWPLAGDDRPSSGPVVVWVGAPPEPPRSQAVVAPGSSLVTTPGGPTPVEPTPAPAPQPTGGLSNVVTAPGSGATPGLEDFVPPPHGPRANIRTLAPAKPGTTLAGRASWYGPGFAGRGTACGTTFDPAQLTLASRELRCGTTVTVTGPSGSVKATVTDWGPAEWTDRRFDLSQATFAAVAGLGAGVVDVTVAVR
jgi:Lytic transglycolase/PASTA domain